MIITQKKEKTEMTRNFR